ncbi:MAG: WbqC family protein [Sideroxydans sp.]|jgi:hypothetical protein
MKKVAILQSNYIPWKGYFDLIAAVDEFILYDDMQYTRRDWRNRNQIKTPQGVQWITVPVKVKGKYHQTIRETEIDGVEWQSEHWKTIVQNYRRAPHFAEVVELFEPLYLQETYTHISTLNRTFIETVCRYLGIHTKISNSWDYTLLDGKTERLADLCVQAGGTEYISGPSAKDYVDEMVFSERNIKLSWFDYTGYTEYPQLWGEFKHGVTILDLIFNCGKDAPRYMRFVR